MASTYKTILDSVVNGLRMLALNGISATNIVVAKVPTDRKGLIASLPGIIVAPFGGKAFTGGTNQRDDISYPVLIATLQSGNQSQTANLDRSLQWHEDIMSYFVHQRLDGAATVQYCTIDPRDVFDPSAFFKNYDAGGMVLRFVSRESRG